MPEATRFPLLMTPYQPLSLRKLRNTPLDVGSEGRGRSLHNDGRGRRAPGRLCHTRWAVTLLLIIIAAAPLRAQTRKLMHRPYIDQRRLHYGFFAGMHMQDIELMNNAFVDEDGNAWYADNGNYEPGFSVGVLAELRLNNHLALRAIPTIHFGTKNVTFLNQTTSEKQYQNIKSTYISLPIDLKIAAERFNNYRPYAVVGINPMYDLTVKQQKQLLMKHLDCYLEIGIGCDFYTHFFKFIPEIKFAYGLLNVIEKNRSDLTSDDQLIFTNSVDKGRSKMIIISFYFE